MKSYYRRKHIKSAEGMVANMSDELMQDLSRLLKEEGSFVKELTDAAVKAAEFHTRLESINKAMESDPGKYDPRKTDELVKKAREKYSDELEKQMKEQCCDELQDN